MADKRLTPARPDLAASSLKGQVEAARFVDGEAAAVMRGHVPLRAAPSDDAGQTSELLFGEIVTVYERKDGWAWVQARTDSYVGYAREDALGAVFNADARIIHPMTPLLSAPDVKSPLRDLLPCNAQVTRGAVEGNFVTVGKGFIAARALAPLDHAATDFVAVAEQFLNVPYVWGGKTFAGLDCSGLIQTAIHAAGFICPRDTDMQEQALGHTISRDELKRGDLVFWKGHVGVMRDANALLHANAFFMQVTSEPLDAATVRITTPVTSIKRL